MKKLIIGGVAVLLALSLVVMACDGIGGEEYTNVIYSDELVDGKIVSKVTLLLEGTVPVDRAARALSSDIAKRGHDFYEVVFISGTTINRATWSIGDSATITGVDRPVDYGSPAAAVLFVGTRTDKTLLAVGKLVEADGGSTTTTVALDTTRVTFEVSSLVGSSSTATLTAGGTPPTATAVTIEGISYTPKSLAFGQANNAVVYPITLSGGTAITGYAGAIKVSAFAATDIYNGVIPRMVQVSDGKSGSITYQSNALTIGATLSGNTTADADFDPDVEFNLDTSVADASAGLVAITFNIPVYAITNDPCNPAQTKDADAVIWNIRPGIGRYAYYLDSGATSQGGAMLFSVGDGPFDIIQIGVQ